EGTPTQEVQVQLYQNDEPVEGAIATLSNDLGWEYEFADLDEFDNQGVPYTYTVKEVEVPEGYISTVDEYDITNTRTGIIDLNVTKEWLDDDESDRPASITLQLSQNGEH